MTVVSIESSARPPSVAVRINDLRLSRVLETGRRHASDLLPALGELLEQAGTSAADITTVIVGTGPGSYTGLRVGIATALGLVRGAGARMQAVPSVEALALRALEPGELGAVLLDARSRQLYFALYERLEEGVRAVRPPTVTNSAELVGLLPRDASIIADEAAAEAAGLDDTLRSMLRTGFAPHADDVLELGLARLEAEGPLAPEQVEPLYLRPFTPNTRRR